jgi:hypothetical protein
MGGVGGWAGDGCLIQRRNEEDGDVFVIFVAVLRLYYFYCVYLYVLLVFYSIAL